MARFFQISDGMWTFRKKLATNLQSPAPAGSRLKISKSIIFRSFLSNSNKTFVSTTLNLTRVYVIKQTFSISSTWFHWKLVRMTGSSIIKSVLNSFPTTQLRGGCAVYCKTKSIVFHISVACKGSVSSEFEAWWKPNFKNMILILLPYLNMFVSWVSLCSKNGWKLW